MANPIFLNFKFGTQPKLPADKAPGTVYITEDSKKLFVDKPTEGSTERICLGDFQLVSWTKSESVETPKTALSNYSLKDANTLYITVESTTGATAMWRYSGSEFKAISNTAEIDGIKSDISNLNTAIASLEGKVLHYGTCNSNANNEEKIVECEGFQLYHGALITVNMKNENSHRTPHLNVNDTGSFMVSITGAKGDSDYKWGAGTITFVYDSDTGFGGVWEMVDSVCYMDAQTAISRAGLAMPRSGGDFTGAITVPAPTKDGHATTKKYVDDAIGEVVTSVDATNEEMKKYMPIAGGKFTGDVEFVSDKYLTVNSPRADANGKTYETDAANREYVDNAKNAAELTASGYVTNAKTAILGTVTTEGKTQDFNGTVKGAYEAAAAAQTTADNAMPITGGEFTGDVQFAKGKALIINDPGSNVKHAATKGYVDGAISDVQGNDETDTKDSKTVAGAKAWATTLVKVVRGTDDNSQVFTGTVKGAYDNAAAAQTTADSALSLANGAMPKSGGEFTGDVKFASGKYLTINSPRTDADGKTYKTDAANREYVDNAKSAAISAVQGNDKTDTQTSATVAGAKKYTDACITSVNTTINGLKDSIGDLSNIMNFLGVTTTTLTDKVATNPITIGNEPITAKHGDVVISGNKELIYVVDSTNSTKTAWHEIGDVSAVSTEISNLTNTVGTKPTAEGTPQMKDTLWNEVTGLRSDVGGTDDGSTKATAFGRIKALEEWKGIHAIEYSDLAEAVTANSKSINDLIKVLEWGSF